MSAGISEKDGAQRGLRVLVVDDDVDAAETLTRLLRAWGHDACPAFSGAAALALVPKFQPHVVLCDLAMPKMDGFSVAKAIRQRVPHAVLVAVSGYADSACRAGALEHGFDRFLVKPPEPDRVRAVLAESALAQRFAER
jgi:CheY-like chemotaxis protein